uniref:Uncharacterized protein n=1 Tax=Pseudomonas phage PACT201 TaxID=3230130 RepID=A0AAU8GTU0_9VIRU
MAIAGYPCHARTDGKGVGSSLGNSQWFPQRADADDSG